MTTQINVTYDHLFTQDYQFADYVPKTEQERQLNLLRDQILKLGTNDSPLNIRVICNRFLFTIISVFKFIEKVSPMLSFPESHDAEQDQYMSCFRTVH